MDFQQSNIDRNHTSKTLRESSGTYFQHFFFVLPPIGSPLKSAGFHHPSRHALGVDGDASQLPPTTATRTTDWWRVGGCPLEESIHGNHWKSIGNHWKSMKINHWKSIKIIGNYWKSMKIIKSFEINWKSMKIIGNQWKSLEINENH